MGDKKEIIKLTETEEERALEIYQKAIVVDAVSVPNMADDRYGNYLHVTNKAGVTALGASIVHIHDIGYTLKNISDCCRRIGKNSDVAVGPVTSAEEIEKAKKDGKTAIMIHFHNTLNLMPNVYYEHGGFPHFPIEPEFPDWLLEIYCKLGARVIQPVRSFGNLVGSGCADRVDYGLTRYGVDAIEAMNRLNIVIDLSHAGIKTTMETIEISKEPVTFTHANAWNLYPGITNRNKTDEQMKALAEKGGVIGTCLWVEVVGKVGKRNIENYLDHIDYIANLIGTDYIGFSHDFAPFWPDRPASENIAWKPHPAEIYNPDLSKDPGSFPNAGPPGHILALAETSTIAKGLVARGYSNQEIMKILGGNFLRIFRRVFGK